MMTEKELMDMVREIKANLQETMQKLDQLSGISNRVANLDFIMQHPWAKAQMGMQKLRSKI